METRERIHRRRLAWLQRSDHPQHSRSRLTDAPRRCVIMERIHAHVSLGRILRISADPLRAALRPSVLAHLDRLPRNPRFVHARERNRLLRELTKGHVLTARLRDCEPG